MVIIHHNNLYIYFLCLQGAHLQDNLEASDSINQSQEPHQTKTEVCCPFNNLLFVECGIVIFS